MLTGPPLTAISCCIATSSALFAVAESTGKLLSSVSASPVLIGMLYRSIIRCRLGSKPPPTPASPKPRSATGCAAVGSFVAKVNVALRMLYVLLVANRT